MSISAGYQIQATSWENDGDNYKTQVISGISSPDVQFYVDLANTFNRSQSVKGLGNSWLSEERFSSIISDLLTVNPDISKELRERFTISSENDYELDNIYEEVCEIIGFPGEGYQEDGMFFRVVEDVKVYYFPDQLPNLIGCFTK
jgi:hypothetical protein